MITRIWHGRTSLQNADNYLKFLLTDGTDGYRQTPGNLSIKDGAEKKKISVIFILLQNGKVWMQ